MLTPCVGIYVITVYYAPKLSSFLCISLFCIQFIHRYSVQWTVISLVHIGVPWTVLKLFCTYSNKLSSDLHTYRMYHMYGPLLHFCVHCAIFYTVTFCNGRLGNLWFGTLTTSCFLLWSRLTLWRFLTQETVTLFCSPGSNLSYCHVVQKSCIRLTVCPCVPVWDLSEQILIYCLVICISC